MSYSFDDCFRLKVHKKPKIIIYNLPWITGTQIGPVVEHQACGVDAVSSRQAFGS